MKKENEPALAPLRERRRELARAAAARRRGASGGCSPRSRPAPAPPGKIVRVEERVYLFNWLPLGAGQFQNGERAKGTAIAAGQLVLGLVNIAAILVHNQIADDRTRTCISGQPGCSRPPYSDSDRTLLSQIDTVKYVSAGLFWALYAYGVWDAHRNFVPRIETEITAGQPGGAVKLEWAF